MITLSLQKKSATQNPITMVTCYDFTMASILSESKVDLLLVGDSVAMVQHGFDSTLHASVEMMALHTAAVARGAKNKPIIGDMPFPSFRLGIVEAMKAVEALMKAGAHAVKLEGVDGHENVIQHIVGSGIPVMGHLGLTPQSVYALGGYKVQGRTQDEATHIMDQAKRLEDLGCCSLVLECVPSELAAKITKMLSIPTIGIGAGDSCDGQVLVLNDLLGLQTQMKPKFVRHFGNGKAEALAAVDKYVEDVHTGRFPLASESYVTTKPSLIPPTPKVSQ
jgi:3-methyl-2-oxobutanoate hydroxymethyltransferase